MPYLLNKQKGATVRHPELGIIPPLTAIEVSNKQAHIYKTISNLILFKQIIYKVREKKKTLSFSDKVLMSDGDIGKVARDF